jgi:hypothetical protein
MTTVKVIENAAAHLPDSDLGEFRAWVAQEDETGDKARAQRCGKVR